MSEWMKIDPKDNSTWPELDKEILFIRHNKKYIGTLLTCENNTKIYGWFSNGWLFEGSGVTHWYPFEAPKPPETEG